jgi:hypothetical protein
MFKKLSIKLSDLNTSTYTHTELPNMTDPSDKLIEIPVLHKKINPHDNSYTVIFGAAYINTVKEIGKLLLTIQNCDNKNNTIFSTLLYLDYFVVIGLLASSLNLPQSSFKKKIIATNQVTGKKHNIKLEIKNGNFIIENKLK